MLKHYSMTTALIYNLIAIKSSRKLFLTKKSNKYFDDALNGFCKVVKLYTLLKSWQALNELKLTF